jgi:hypothetical protein
MKAVPAREDRLVLEVIGVNQSLPEGVSSPSEAIQRSISSHAHQLPSRLLTSADRVVC